MSTLRCAPPPTTPCHLQAVLPRTSKVDRLESNLDLYSFDLADEDMQQLDALDGTSPLVQQ